MTLQRAPVLGFLGVTGAAREVGAFLVERRTRLLAAWAVPLLRAGLDEAAAAAEVTGQDHGQK